MTSALVMRIHVAHNFAFRMRDRSSHSQTCREEHSPELFVAPFPELLPKSCVRSEQIHTVRNAEPLHDSTHRNLLLEAHSTNNAIHPHGPIHFREYLQVRELQLHSPMPTEKVTAACPVIERTL